MSNDYITNVKTEQGDPAYNIPVNAEFNEKIKALRNNEPVNAEQVVNPLIQKVIDNTFAVRDMVKSYTLISAGEPSKWGCSVWLKPVGGIIFDRAGDGTNSSVINVFGVHIGQDPPGSTEKLWVKPEA